MRIRDTRGRAIELRPVLDPPHVELTELEPTETIVVTGTCVDPDVSPLVDGVIERGGRRYRITAHDPATGEVTLEAAE